MKEVNYDMWKGVISDEWNVLDTSTVCIWTIFIDCSSLKNEKEDESFQTTTKW